MARAAGTGLPIAAEAVFAVSTDGARSVVWSPTNQARCGYQPLYCLYYSLTDVLPLAHR